MKLGAEPKKVAMLGGILLVGVIAYFSSSDGPPRDNTPARPAQRTVPPAPRPASNAPVVTKSSSQRIPANRRGTQEFKPVLKSRRVEDRVDPTTVDPTLHLEWIARLANTPIQGGNRPLFEFGSAPPPKAPDPGKIIPKPQVVAPPPTPQRSVATTSAKPTAPQIPLKFYGFIGGRTGPRRAFFLENEDVYVAVEGDVVKKRYKVVRINLNSVVMEDMDFKSQQTLPLVEQTT